MNVKGFRAAREAYHDKLFVYKTYEYMRGILEGMTAAAKPEHVGEYASERSCDLVKCSCGWKSQGYWDGAEYAWDEWREHVADEMGLLTKKCPCGKEYLPADGGKACHKLEAVKG